MSDFYNMKTTTKNNTLKKIQYVSNEEIITNENIVNTKNKNLHHTQENIKTSEYGLTFPCNESPNLFINNLKFRLKNYGCMQALNKDDLVL